MTMTATSITKLAQAIILDDVTDVFYRSLVYPFFLRCDEDEKTELQATLDKKLEVKLGRQLHWTAALTSLDTVTHKFSHFIELVHSNKLDPNRLNKILADNYWLKPAFEKARQGMALSDDVRVRLANPDEGERVNELVMQICWHYFHSQMAQPDQDILSRIFVLSNLFVEQALELAEQQNLHVERDDLFQLALFNAFPMVVLLRLFDKSMQSSKQDMLNIVGMENSAERKKIDEYQPSADILLSFFTFDEFVKPHVLESLNIPSHLQTNLILGQDELSDTSRLFLQGRTKAIRDMLGKTLVLTHAQMEKYKEQLGIEFQVNLSEDVGETQEQVLSKLLAI